MPLVVVLDGMASDIAAARDDMALDAVRGATNAAPSIAASDFANTAEGDNAKASVVNANTQWQHEDCMSERDFNRAAFRIRSHNHTKVALQQIKVNREFTK